MTTSTINDSSYQAFYESNPSRASRLLDALANRLNQAADPELSRKILMDLADKISVSKGFRLHSYRDSQVGCTPMMTIADYEQSLNSNPADIVEPERRLENLLAYIWSQPDPISIAKWFIEALAVEMMMSVAVGDGDDPVRNLRIMARAFVESFMWAGAVEPTHRQELVRIVRDMVEDIKD